MERRVVAPHAVDVQVVVLLEISPQLVRVLVPDAREQRQFFAPTASKRRMAKLT